MPSVSVSPGPSAASQRTAISPRGPKVHGRDVGGPWCVLVLFLLVVGLAHFVPGMTADRVTLVDGPLIVAILLALAATATVVAPPVLAVQPTALLALWLTATLVPFVIDVDTSVLGLARTVAVEAYLVAAGAAVLYLLRRAGPRRRDLAVAITAGLAVVSGEVLLASSDSIRAAGFFPNPNYAGHFLVLFALVAIAVDRHAGSLAVMAALPGIVATGSFSAYLMLLVGLGGFLLVGVLGRLAPVARTAAVVMAAAIALGALAVVATVQLPDGRADTADIPVDLDRLDRSSSSRLGIWSAAWQGYQGPALVGRGAGETVRQGVLPGELEIHSDVIASVLERGPMGAIALFGLVGWLWRRLDRHGRVVLVAAVVGGLTKETLHFRHLPVAIAMIAWLSGQRPGAGP